MRTPTQQHFSPVIGRHYTCYTRLIQTTGRLLFRQPPYCWVPSIELEQVNGPANCRLLLYGTGWIYKVQIKWAAWIILGPSDFLLVIFSQLNIRALMTWPNSLGVEQTFWLIVRRIPSVNDKFAIYYNEPLTPFCSLAVGWRIGTLPAKTKNNWNCWPIGGKTFWLIIFVWCCSLVVLCRTSSWSMTTSISRWAAGSGARSSGWLIKSSIAQLPCVL